MVTKNTSALPQNPLGQRLWQVFGHYPWSFIHKTDGKKHWETESRYPLRPRLLWKHWQDANVQIGVRFGSTTRYAVIDIDKGSPYLKQNALTEIDDALETLGIVRTVRLRSSWSGGLHLYLPLPEMVNTFDLAIALKGTLEAHGFTIQQGQLEIFPNVKAFGRCWLNEFVEYLGHRLPLQPGSGSVLLNHALQPIGDSLERFWWAWDAAARLQDVDLLHQALAAGKRNRKRVRHIQMPFEQWRADLQSEIAEGWTGPSQTNHLLKQMCTYGRVFLGLAGTELATYAQDVAMASPGYSSWCRHTHEITRKCLSWARSVEKYYFPAQEGGTKGAQYPLQETPNGNKQRSWDAVQRIWRAVQELSADQALMPQTISEWVECLVERAQVSTRTLYKHKEYWHPRCKEPIDTSYLRLAEPDFSEVQPAPENRRDRPLVNGFLHLEREMKCYPPEILHQQNLSPGGIGGCGGKGRFSTEPEGG